MTFEIEPLSLAQGICRRPRMWTVGGTIGEVLALFNGFEIGFNGFEIGARSSSGKPSDTSPSEALDWLYSQIGLTRSQAYDVPPSKIHDELISLFGTSEAAIAALNQHLSQSKSVGG